MRTTAQQVYSAIHAVYRWATHQSAIQDIFKEQFHAYRHMDNTPARAALYRRPNVLISMNARRWNGSRQICKHTATHNGANVKALAERSGRRV